MERGGSSGGGCCIARYTNNNTTYPYNYYTNDVGVSKMDRIMLRFRPIAPKPTVVSGPNPTSSVGSNGDVKANNVVSKRKRNNDNPTVKAVKGRKKSRSPSNGQEKRHVVTLPLLPETPDLSNNKNGCDKSVPTWLCFGPSDEDLTAQTQEVVPSSVTVEGVSDAWLDGNSLGGTDEERRRRLEEDTCPGFISDGWNRVWWTNKEYRRMVTGGGDEDTWRKERLVSVRLEMREKVEKLYAAFTCRVRVQYGGHTMTVPCDVWRMNDGGFAWRLDVKAALCLAL